jgi:GR25 family glycosyltransferase involved in LPS biosynthesis
MPLAPIILFTYNRPWHTKQVLDKLVLNEEAKDSILYIYCDGAKENAGQVALDKINEVRALVKSESRFKQVLVKEQLKNKGLANSIIDGVTEIINKHGTAIILEDDIVPEKGFLQYMNTALDMYKQNEKVGCIHAWNYVLDTRNYKESTFFLKGADCWGWATWKRAWDEFNPNGTELLNKISSSRSAFEFNRKGTQKFVDMLKQQIEGKNDSWAIRWYASLFLNNKYCLHPTNAIVKNIGFDSSGVHCETNDLKQNTVEFISVKQIPVLESEWFFKEYAKSNKEKQDTQFIKQTKQLVKKVVPPLILSVYRKLRG